MNWLLEITPTLPSQPSVFQGTSSNAVIAVLIRWALQAEMFFPDNSTPFL